MFNKKKREQKLRDQIGRDIYKVERDILEESWDETNRALIQGCFDIARRVACGYEHKQINLNKSN